MEPTRSGMLGAVGFGGEELATVRGFLARFGAELHAATRAFRLNLSARSVNRHFDTVGTRLANVRLEESIPPGAPTDPTKSLARLAGASLLVEAFPGRVRASDFSRSFALKVLYEYLQDGLDHVLDHATSSYEDAVRLYRLCFGRLTEPHADFRGLEDELRATLDPGQVSAAAPLASLTRTLHDRIADSPNGEELRPYLGWVNERFAAAQAASVFLRRSSLEVATIRRIASGFWAPDSDLAWSERFHAYLSWVTNMSLFDLCVARELPSPAELRDHMLAWYYFDATICRLDHLADVWTDLWDGIVNVALLAMNGSEAGLARDARPSAGDFPRDDVERFLARTAEFERRALRFAVRSQDDPDDFYPLLAVLIPIVMLSRCEPDRQWLLPRYLQDLAPALEDAGARAYHSTAYSQQASPCRTHRGFATLPWNPRAFRTPS